ncbi:MAG: hypothetical protein U0Z70_10110 [Thermomicrobiales bacterium]
MVDERSFDNLVRDLAASAQTRRALTMAAVGLALSFTAPLARDADAARRRQARRKKNRKSGQNKQGGSGKGSAGGKGQHRGDQGDCGQPGACTPDPQTGDAGFSCPDGQCSCGGACCEKGYACFLENTTPGREVCCFIDGDNSPLPEDAKLVSCPGELFSSQICCEREHCQEDGSCSGFTLTRYRRNPR